MWTHLYLYLEKVPTRAAGSSSVGGFWPRRLWYPDSALSHSFSIPAKQSKARCNLLKEIVY